MSDIRRDNDRLGLPPQETISLVAQNLANAAARLAILVCSSDENASLLSLDERKNAQPGAAIPELLSPKERTLLPGAYDVVNDIIQAVIVMGNPNG